MLSNSLFEKLLEDSNAEFATPVEMKLEQDLLIINKNETNYLSTLQEKSNVEKSMFLKFCLINCRLFAKKFFNGSNESNHLIKYLDIDNVIYILRNLVVDLATKNLLVEFMSDFYLLQSLETTNKEHSDNLEKIVNILVQDFSLRLDGSFNDSVFKLVSIYLKTSKLQKPARLLSSITATISSNISAKKDSEHQESFIEQLIMTLKFTNLLLKDQTQLNYTLCLLSSNDCVILTNVLQLISLKSSDQSSDLINDLADSTFAMFQQLFRSLYQAETIFQEDLSVIENKIFNEQFIRSIEKLCLIETEAFSRREMIQFLSEFSFYKLKSFVVLLSNNISASNSAEYGSFNLKLWNTCNFFSYFLINELDWQVQLNCLSYFQTVFEFLCSEVSTNKTGVSQIPAFERDAKQTKHESSELTRSLTSFSVFEVIFYVSDCSKSLVKCLTSGNYQDKHVLVQCCQLMLLLSKDTRCVALLNETLTKHNQIYQTDLKSNYMANMKLELATADLELAVGLPATTQTDSNEIIVEVDSDDDENYLKKFLDMCGSFEFEAKLIESQQTGDLYTQNPEGILDDIISSYQFDVDNEKIVDCY
jgi:hypothetical protein